MKVGGSSLALVLDLILKILWNFFVNFFALVIIVSCYDCTRKLVWLALIFVCFDLIGCRGGVLWPLKHTRRLRVSEPVCYPTTCLSPSPPPATYNNGIISFIGHGITTTVYASGRRYLKHNSPVVGSQLTSTLQNFRNPIKRTVRLDVVRHGFVPRHKGGVQL